MSANTTVSANTRATRSRFSSPQTAANGTPDPSSSSRAHHQGSGSGSGTNGTSGGEGQKTFMQRWLEPPVQVKASYQDAGLVRQGVFENMAPLGTLPKVGLFKKTAPPPAAAPERPPVRRIIVKQNGAAFTPAPAVPAPPPPPAPEEDETEADETEEEDEDDGKTEEQNEEKLGGEANAGPANKEGHQARSTAASQRSRRSVASGETDDEEWAPGTSAQKARTRRSASRASTGPLQQPATGASASAVPRQVTQRELIDKVVEVAVGEALTHLRYPTAWALRTLYDENSSNQEFLDTIQKVFLQTANADELEHFARRIHALKLQGQKHNKALHYFVPPPAANSPSAPQQEPKKAPYGNLVKFDISTLRLGQNGSTTKSQKRERQVDDAPEQPAPERAAEPEPELPAGPPRKKRKSGRQQSEATPSSSKMAANGVHGKANPETPSRSKRARARSVSSISSLSSARSLSPPDGIPEDGDDQGSDEAPPSRTSPAPAAQQPITATKRRRSNAPRKSRNVSPSRPSPAVSTSTAPQQPAAAATPSQSQRQSPAAEQPAARPEQQPYEMPAVVDAPLFPNLNSKKGSKSGTPALVLATKLGKLDPEDQSLRHRQQARKVTSRAFPVSNIRGSSPQAASEQEKPEESLARPATPATAPASRPRTTLPSARATPAPREGRSTRSSLKRTHDDLEDQPSPITANFPGSEAASTVADSRAGTPALRAAKKPRTGLRVKNSPMKKKNGPSAGIPRPSGERSSPVGNAPREDDNDDYCSSCGGNGELICCDGCTRSFHFSCVDPVLSHDAMPVEWFCNVCRINRDPAHLPTHGGAFAQALEKLDARNSSAFRLPGPVRDRFEGVRTGVDGEYEEPSNVVKPPARKKKNDEEQIPDLHRIRDAEGNAIVCHSCQKSSATDRPIITCTACGLYWHMDCLDPPLAYPPVLRTWKCPLHADSLLATLPGLLHPAHKYRKVKDAPIIRPTFTRGYVNNGHIEVDLDDSDDESGWRDVETFGRTVRLSEKGIKLDFLARVHKLREKTVPPAAPAVPAPRPMAQRSLEEQQAALNLAQLSGARDDGVATLIDAMISQADPSVIDLMARAEPSHLENTQLNQMDQQSLRAILARAESMTEQIRKLLASGTPAQPVPQTVSAKATVPAEVEEAPATVPSLTNSQSPDPESVNSANLDANTSAMEIDAAKSPASSAPTDDLPAMTQGEKTPVQGDQSPAAPLPLEESAPIENGGLPATPTKAAALPGDEPVVLEAGGDGEKALGEGQIEME